MKMLLTTSAREEDAPTSIGSTVLDMRLISLGDESEVKLMSRAGIS